MLACGPRRLVFSSTAAVYGEPESIPIQEDARLAPTNPYGQSKLLVEQMLAWFNRIHGLRYASLRYFNVAGAPEGPHGITRGEAHEPESHLIPLVLDVALGRRPPSASTATTTPPLTAPASATTSMSPTWPTRTCWRSPPSPRPRTAPAHLQPRQRQGFQCPRGHRVGAPRHRPSHPGGDPSPPAGRSCRAGRQFRKSHPRAGLEAALYRLDEIVRTAWVWHQKRYSALESEPHPRDADAAHLFAIDRRNHREGLLRAERRGGESRRQAGSLSAHAPPARRRNPQPST